MQPTIASARIECQRFFDVITEPLADTPVFGKVTENLGPWKLHATSENQFRNAKNLCSLTEKLKFRGQETETWTGPPLSRQQLLGPGA